MISAAKRSETQRNITSRGQPASLGCVQTSQRRAPRRSPCFSRRRFSNCIALAVLHCTVLHRSVCSLLFVCAGLDMYVNRMRAHGPIPLANGHSVTINHVYVNLANPNDWSTRVDYSPPMSDAISGFPYVRIKIDARTHCHTPQRARPWPLGMAVGRLVLTGRWALCP